MNDTILLVQQLNRLRRHRDGLLEHERQQRRALPDFPFSPLRLAGMSRSEICDLFEEIGQAERAAGLDKLDDELQRTDEQIKLLEDRLLMPSTPSLLAAQAVIGLSLDYFSRRFPLDPDDVDYDHRIVRVVQLIAKVDEDLEHLLGQELRQVS